MEDKSFDEKMKDIEREIDSAIDQLFVDKIAETKSDFEAFEPQQEIVLDQEVAEEKLAEAEKGKKEEKKKAETLPSLPEHPSEDILAKDETESVSQDLETLKSRVEKFLEWGVTATALDNVLQAIQKIRRDFVENKFVDSVSHMITDVLGFLKENPESHLKEMVDFLVNAIGATQRIIKSEKEEGIDAGEVFNSINAQFSSVSSMLTFDIPKIDLEERFAIPSEEEAEHSSEETGVKEEVEVESPTSPEIGLVDLGAHEEEKKYEKKETVIETKEAEKESEEHGFAQVAMVEEETAEAIVQGESDRTETIPAFKTFNQIVSEFSKALKDIEGNFYKKNNVLALIGKLSAEMDTLLNITEKFASTVSYGVPSDNDTQQLQKNVNEISRDFRMLSSVFDDQKSLRTEEITPIMIGRKMMGLFSTSVKNIYSVSDEQASRIKQKGNLSIKGEEIPFIDLLEKFGETSSGNPNKRIVVVENLGEKKALLVSRVMKRRFALISDLEESEIQKNAKFYFSEEIPIYEI